MKLKIKLITLVLALAMVQGCAPGGMNKQTGGTLIGGAAGGLLGAQFGKGKGAVAMGTIGALVGALAGGQVGAQMDETDKQLAANSSQQALESAPVGRTVGWQNPDNGHYGSITPTKTFKNSHGEYCREYSQQVTIAGKKQNAYGKACRKPDGTWKIIK